MRLAWIFVNALPLLALLILRNFAREPVLAFGAFVLWIAAGQAIAVRRVRWAVMTLVALLVAAFVAFAILALGDAAGHESAAIVLGHIAGGVVFAAIQHPRKRWILANAVIWTILSFVLAAATLLGWHPAGNLSLFPGYRELSAVVVLFAGYGIASAFLLPGRELTRSR